MVMLDKISKLRAPVLDFYRYCHYSLSFIRGGGFFGLFTFPSYFLVARVFTGWPQGPHRGGGFFPHGGGPTPFMLIERRKVCKNKVLDTQEDAVRIYCPNT